MLSVYHCRQMLYRLSLPGKSYIIELADMSQLAQGLGKVNSTILDLVGSNQFSYGCVIPNKIPLYN